MEQPTVEEFALHAVVSLFSAALAPALAGREHSVHNALYITFSSAKCKLEQNEPLWHRTHSTETDDYSGGSQSGILQLAS